MNGRVLDVSFRLATTSDMVLRGGYDEPRLWSRAGDPSGSPTQIWEL